LGKLNGWVMTRKNEVEKLLLQLREKSSQEGLDGQKRFGISGRNMLGVSIYDIRRLSKGIRDHEIALDLWASEIHDARLMACFVDIPQKVTRDQMDTWVADFDSWDLCDQATTSLFDLTPFALHAVFDWVKEEEEFTRRAAFSTIAGLAVHNHEMIDRDFENYLPLIREYSADPRNFVKKGVNWALRNIGKRNDTLLVKCIQFAEELQQIDDKTARWIASDTLRELRKRMNSAKR
jgi:3-methyladenine DNA glycosylase AlkD